MPTYRLLLGYDGTGFHGFARQPGVRTVQGVLEEALSKVFGEPVLTVGAGRTDTGVHARGQVVSFVTERRRDTRRVANGVASMLGPEVVAFDCEIVADDFDARFSARWRSYRYRVLNRRRPDPLLRHTVWHVSDPLDLDLMNDAAGRLVGEHDFASFCRRHEGRTTLRQVLESRWDVVEELTVYTVTATAFCHQMVRSLTGQLVDVGRGRVVPDSIDQVLAANDRRAARPMAPATGLVLWEVGY